MPLTIPVLDCATGDGPALLAGLRQKLSLQGDVVSEAGRARTVTLFGEPLAPRQVVQRICQDVRVMGLPAVLDYTARIDGARLTAETLRVTAAELAEAHAQADPKLLKSIRRIQSNIREFQDRIRHCDAQLVRQDGTSRVELRQRYLPLKRVGLCVPGGAAAYPSTVLMTAVPAQAAGVRELVVVVPPTKFGGYNPDLLATCAELGIREIYRAGGAQAVAMLAYGVEGIPRVDKIVGPGNLFVALAKQHVYGDVDIDSIAGPSEVVVLADDTADPRYVAADLLSQAEHSPGSAVLITWHRPLVDAVIAELGVQLGKLPRGEITLPSLNEYSAILIARDSVHATELSDLLAPEHLHISTADPRQELARVQNAGAIFMGHYTPVAVGDYFAGPSHVLPTSGTARFANGLCVNDFLKRTSVISYNRDALEDAAEDIERLAGVEGLTAHAASVRIRLQDDSE